MTRGDRNEARFENVRAICEAVPYVWWFLPPRSTYANFTKCITAPWSQRRQRPIEKSEAVLLFACARTWPLLALDTADNFVLLATLSLLLFSLLLSYRGSSRLSTRAQYSLELWQEMLTDFIGEKSRSPQEQWIVMGNSIGGLLTLMLTEGLQGEQKVAACSSGTKRVTNGKRMPCPTGRQPFCASISPRVRCTNERARR